MGCVPRTRTSGEAYADPSPGLFVWVPSRAGGVPASNANEPATLGRMRLASAYNSLGLSLDVREFVVYHDWLQCVVDGQRSAVLNVLRMVVSPMVAAASGGILRNARVEFFGSRSYGVILPSSDIDLVVFAGALGGSFLDAALASLLLNEICDRVHDAIEGKHTVSFRSLGFHIDLTATFEDCVAHGPSLMTAFVDRVLGPAPCSTRVLCLLVVDWAKRVGVCHDRVGVIGSTLKAVHWVLLTVAYVHSLPSGILGNPFVEFPRLVWFYSSFDFEGLVISVTDPSAPFSTRVFPDLYQCRAKWIGTGWRRCWNPVCYCRPISLLDPVLPDRNLAIRVDVASLRLIRARLLECLAALQSGSFVRDARAAWWRVWWICQNRF